MTGFHRTPTFLSSSDAENALCLPRSHAAAETAYTECLTLDKKVELLQAAASSAGKGASVAAELAAYSPAVPPTPPTEAVLLTMAPAGDFPGAQFRLAGDRWGFYRVQG